MTNATFWVRYADRETGTLGMMTLRSPDLAQRAVIRAARTSKARLAKKGLKVDILHVQCVG